MKVGKGTGVALMPRHADRKATVTKSRVPMGQWMVRIMGVFLARAVPVGGLAPFGLAFLAMERRCSKQSLISLFMVSLGYLSLGRIDALWYIGAGILYEALLFFLDNGEDVGLKGTLLTVVLATAFFDVLRMFREGIGLEPFFRLGADVALVALGVLVFDRCRGCMEGKGFLLRIPSVEEKLALGMMCAIGLLSFYGIPLPFGFSVANVLGLTLAGAIGVAGGMITGVLGGLAVGGVLGLKGELLTCLAVFGCSGLACGLGQRRGKWVGAAVLTGVGVLLSGYAMGSGSEAIRFYEVPVATIGLLALPKSVLGVVGKFTQVKVKEDDGVYFCRQQMQEKLEMAADSFSHLAQTFLRISDKPNQIDTEDIASMLDMAAERVCGRCGRMHECWEKQFHTTYKSLLRGIEVLEHKGGLEAEDMGSYFSQRCLRTETMVKELNRLFEVYKINRVWKSKLCENRELVSQQFHGVAEILRRISDEVGMVTAFDSLAAEEIACRLRSKGVAVLQVRVMQLAKERRMVQLVVEPPFSETLQRTMLQVLKSVFGTSFLPSRIRMSEEPCGAMLQFYQVPEFNMQTGYASTCKQEENGDSCSVRHLQGGKYLATLSDGMGCGHSANRESSTIVTLLEDFMEAGFDKTLAVKLINSVMVMKSANEAFATVDMCMVDLHTGEAEFIKNGAEASYIKRGNRVETVRGASLPVGVVSRMDIETFVHKLERDDMVVMVSDGLELRKGHEGWIRHAVEHAPKGMPAQELADRIMEQALALKGGVADDDMTVMVLCVE